MRDAEEVSDSGDAARPQKPGAAGASQETTRYQPTPRGGRGALPALPVKVQSPRPPAVAPTASPSPRAPAVSPGQPTRPRAPSYTNETQVTRPINQPAAAAKAANAGAPDRVAAETAPARPEHIVRRDSESEPPSGGWDSADTVTSFPDPADLPAQTPRMPPVAERAVKVEAAPSPATQASPATAVPATPVSPGTRRGPYETSPGFGAPPPPLPAAGSPAPSPRAPAVAAAHAPANPRAPARAAAPAAPAPGGTAAMGINNLAAGMREEVWAIVRAAIDDAMGPLVARQRELEARVERAERERDAALRGRPAQGAQPQPFTSPQGGGQGGGAGGTGGASASTAASRLAALGPSLAMSSIPVAMGPSLAPPVFSAQAPAVPTLDTGSATSLPVSGASTIPDIKVGTGASGSGAHPVGPRPSFAPTGYGVTVTRSMRPSLDLENVGPIDIEGFDGGARKRKVAGFVVILMLLLIAGAITMTVMSHN